MEGVEKNKVRLLSHQSHWEEEFLEVKETLMHCLGELVVDIQHVGSTAIPAICAKPILDVAVCVTSIGEIDLKALTSLGYSYCGIEHYPSTHLLFVLRSSQQISLHHIHCYDQSDKEFQLLVGFRDYLNDHLDVALQYQELKKKLANQFPSDRKSYTKGKEAFIRSVYHMILENSPKENSRFH